MFDRPNHHHRENGERARARDAWAAPFAELGEDVALLAILVTDLEGFTRMVVKLGDAAAQRVIQAHNRMLRECLSARSGREITHTGDGVIAAFRSVARALSCASEMQRAVQRYNRAHAECPLRVRIGIHAGEPLPEEGRLFGACIITAVRICSVSPAQGVLCSGVVRELAELLWRARRPASST